MAKKLIGSAALTSSDTGFDLTTKGDTHGFSNQNARIPISTNNFSLLCDSAESLGLKWASSPTSVLSGAQDILYSSAANTLARLAAGTDGDLLTTHGTGSAPTWETPSGGGAWAEIANQDDGDDFSIGDSTSTLFDDYKYIRVIGDFAQAANNYVEFDFIDTVGIVTGNTQINIWVEPGNIGLISSATDRNCCGYIEAGNIIFVDFLFQTQTAGTHQCVNWNTNASGNNANAYLAGVFWIGTSNRLKGFEHSGLSAITASSCSYKVLGLT